MEKKVKEFISLKVKEVMRKRKKKEFESSLLTDSEKVHNFLTWLYNPIKDELAPPQYFVISKPFNMYLLQFFKYEHLPANLAQVSQPFCELAHYIANELPQNIETEAALRKLLEAKDCAVRAKFLKPEVVAVLD